MAERLRERLRRFIVENYLAGSDREGFADDDSFLEKGIIDSIGVIELAQFLQSEFGFKVEPKDIVPENFDTLANLERFVESRRGNAK